MNNEITINVEELLKVEDNSITDCETIRQIALIGYTKYGIPKDIHSKLIKKINPLYTFCGLYPEVINYLDVKPDSDLVLRVCDKLSKNRENRKIDFYNPTINDNKIL